MKITISNQEIRRIHDAMRVVDPNTTASICSLEKATANWDILSFSEDSHGVTIHVNEKFVVDALVSMAPHCAIVMSMIKAMYGSFFVMFNGMKSLIEKYKKPDDDQW